MSANVFPQTRRTWIDDALDRGGDGVRDVNGHIMETYAWPLRVYYLGTNSRWLGEPDEVIDGFFADRLARDSFLGDWRASGLRLRRWLINAFCFYLLELRRRKLGAERPGEAFDEPVTFSGDPHVEIDRAAVVAFVRQALERAAERCESEGLEDHWRVFMRHHHDGASFRDVAVEFKVDAARAAVMARTAARKFRTALREVLMRDGVSATDIDREIQSLLEVSGS